MTIRYRKTVSLLLVVAAVAGCMLIAHLQRDDAPGDGAATGAMPEPIGVIPEETRIPTPAATPTTPSGTEQPRLYSPADPRSSVPGLAGRDPSTFDRKGFFYQPDPVARLQEEMSDEEKNALAERGVLLNSDRSLAALRRDPGVILLRNAIIDAAVVAAGGASVDIPAEYRARPDTTRHIVLLQDAVSEQQKALLTRTGATLEHYVPNRGYALTADDDALAKLRDLAAVRHIEPFHPYFKMSADVQGYLLGTADEKVREHVEKGRYSVLLFSCDDPGAELIKLGAQVTLDKGIGDVRMANVTCPVELLPDIVRAESVKWVQTRVAPALCNDLAYVTTRASGARFEHPNLDGDGVVVAVMDTGVDHMHRAFSEDMAQETQYPGQNSRIVHYQNSPNYFLADGAPGDDQGHGSHVSASILGNGGWSENVIKAPGSGSAPYSTNHFHGIAPKAGLVMFEGLIGTGTGDPDALRDDVLSVTKTAYDHGARLMNNSWGSTVYFDYQIESMIWDEVVRDADQLTPGRQPMVVFFAAANNGAGAEDGTGGTAGTIPDPGNAKNVITVGALEQRRFADNLPGAEEQTDSYWQVASYSSRGPIADGRVKPDVMAPGSYVMSAQTRDVDMDHVEFTEPVGRDYRHGNLDSGTNYAVLSGTSMASPLTCGLGALIFQWYTNTYEQTPAPATVKALLVNGAVELSPWHYDFFDPTRTPVIDGWGGADLHRSIKGTSARQTDGLVIENEQSSIDGTGWTNTTVYAVPENHEGGLKITLAWSDFQATPDAGVALVNNLDLVVRSPDGTFYYGNFMGKRGWGSSSYPVTFLDNGLGDILNNVENVIIPYTIAGDYEISVSGKQVPNPSQPYSLVIAKGASGIGGSPGGVDGSGPDIAVHSDGSPVMVYSGLGGIYAGDYQIFVRRWYGSFGDGSQFGTWQHLRDKWHYHEFGGIVEEAISASVLGDASYEPSVAVNPANDYVYVTWRQKSWDPDWRDAAYLRYFDGTSWQQLGGSYQDHGISSDNTEENVEAPVVTIAWDGQPIVAYIQDHDTGTDITESVRVKKWNGAAWLGLDGAVDGRLGLPLSYSRSDLEIDTDTNGWPVVVWRENGDGVVVCHRWTGAAWTKVGGDLGFDNGANDPDVVCDDAGGIYVVWDQAADGGSIPEGAVMMAYAAGGGAWTAVGGSMTYPGVGLATNRSPANPHVAYANNKVFVSWQLPGDTYSGTYVFCRHWDGAQWLSTGGAEGPPGAVQLGYNTTLTGMDVNQYDAPVIGILNDRSAGQIEVDAFGLVGHTGPPPFLGLRTALGNSSNEVELGWLAIPDPSGAVTYHVYVSTNSYDPASTNIPSPTDPGAIASVFGNPTGTVQDVSGTVISNLTADRVWYWGVRAENSGGFMESNTVIRLAGPYSLFGDADGDWLPAIEEERIGTIPVIPDTDGDGMWDGWEWFYSPSNSPGTAVTGVPPHTAVLAMNPLNNGDQQYGTTNAGTGEDGQHWYDDLDGDGLLNREEFEYWRTHAGTGDWSFAKAANLTNWYLNPTDTDSDGDTMGDAYEMFNELDPGDPADRWLDNDGDLLTNWQEHALGTDPNFADSDHDGRTDGEEVHIDGSQPTSPDTDGDGLDDGIEVQVNGDPLDQDSNDNDVSDGHEYQIGYADVAVSNPVVQFLYDHNGNILIEDCDGSPYAGSHTNWVRSPLNTMWHRTLVEPDSQIPTGAIPVEVIYAHTTNHSFRFANDAEDGVNTNATYHMSGQFVEGELLSPAFNANTSLVSYMHVSWNEYYETEAGWDVCEVFASRDNGVNWEAVRPDVSGLSTGWVHRVADISDFRLDTNVIVRFQFKTKNIINNHFRGWWVDDIKIYGGARIEGYVRDLNGAPIKGARVVAIGRTVTNMVHGHAYEYPGGMFEDDTTEADGYYSIEGLALGNYYVKADASGFRAEFWNGELWPVSSNFWEAFGLEINAGVYNLSEATNGFLVLTNYSDTARCDFELGRGAGAGRIGVLHTNRPTRVFLGQYVTNSYVWDGNTNSPGETNLHWTAYTTTNLQGGANDPDYYVNTVVPALLDNVSPGNHQPWLQPDWPGMPLVSRLQLPVRAGEMTIVEMRTNQVPVRLDVLAAEADYDIWLDGADTGEKTPGDYEVVTFDVLEGEHLVQLVDTNVFRRWIAPVEVNIPIAGRGIAWFHPDHTGGEMGQVTVRTLDVHGDTVSNATVYVNGMSMHTNDVPGTNLLTTVTVSNLVSGLHWITVTKEGYRAPPPVPVGIYTGVTSEIIVRIHEADGDYDGVGDALEAEGYTNIFAYSGQDDADGDALSGVTEFNVFLDYGIRLGLFDADTDDDQLTDGEEMGYDGDTNSLALSTLSTNATLPDLGLGVWFVGRFLEGVSAFPTPDNFDTNNVRLSADGDQTIPLSVVWMKGAFQRPVLFYDLPIVGDDEVILNQSYLPGTEVFADTYPDRKDSDGDFMWDGWENLFSDRTVGILRTNVFSEPPPDVVTFSDAGLNPIDNASAQDDPDWDGLVNVDEFIGLDFVANTNDWTRPEDPDTDRDFMPDGWEIEHLLDPRDWLNAQYDPDGDLLVNIDEWQYGTDPQEEDTDTDLIMDGQEVHIYGCDPTIVDTDLDMLSDGQEVIDTDGDISDGNPDGGFFPNWNGGDMDEDGLVDGPTDWDTDGDGMPDGFEVLDAFWNIRPVGMRLDPSDPDDAEEDPDGDFLTNYEEWLIRDGRAGLSPNNFLGLSPVFLETGGVAVVEMESSTPYDDWVLESSYGGFTGTGYFTYLAEFNRTWAPSDFFDAPFSVYYVDITKAGTYTFEMRHRHANPNPALENTCWVRLDESGWRYTTSTGAGAWVFTTTQQDEFFVPVPNTYVLDAGRHRFDVAGGRTNASYDRFHIYHTDATAPDASVPESEIVDFVGAAQFIWDYPTEPFNGDSDGDGMPDGWEAWHGLHPWDPIPMPELTVGYQVRYEDLWLFGDLDQDGVENINEYDYRFVLDAGADSNALEGSLHPWFDDTDEDTLKDGDEIKSMRSHPLLQDSDGDGLMDGQLFDTVEGEVNTRDGSEVHLDDALNDLWYLAMPLGGLAFWGQVWEDGPVLYVETFDEASNGYVAVEIENVLFDNPGDPVLNRIIPPGWLEGTDPVPVPPVDYLEYDNYVFRLDFINDGPPDGTEHLFYRVNINEPAAYTFKAHTFYDNFGFPPDADEDPYEDTSFWLRIDSGQWRKIATDGNPYPMSGQWNWNTKQIWGQNASDTEGYLLDVVVALDPGPHLITIAGRAWGLQLDRFVLHTESVVGTNLALTSPIVSTNAMNPEPRWGGGAAVTTFNLIDDGAGSYVGGLVYGNAVKQQYLLGCNSFMLFGGRDGTKRFNEIWEVKDLSLFFLTWDENTIFGYGPLSGEYLPAAHTELVAAKRYEVSSSAGYGPPNLPGRPRPGSLPGYQYYDGDKGADPIEIWGEDGAYNSSRASFITGWTDDYEYMGGLAHDEVEVWGREYLLDIPPYYVPMDDKPEIIYQWGSAAEACQTNRNDDPLQVFEDDNKVRMGADGTNDNQVLYTGINIGPVLNTKFDYAAADSLVAFLQLVSANTVPTGFSVEVFGELFGNPVGTSVENPQTHTVLTSPEDYGTLDPDNWPSKRQILTPHDPEWTFNTLTNTVTIPPIGPNQQVRINVTPQVLEMLNARVVVGSQVATWELGCNMGFVIKGVTNSPGMFKFWRGLSQLRIQIGNPPWYRAGSQIWVPAAPQRLPHRRKSAAMEYDYFNEVFTLFGGVDGNRVLDDTWISPDALTWEILYPVHRPPARWGHGMVEGATGMLVFGGFDENNRPLNDLWHWDGVDWTEINVFADQDLRTGETVYVSDKPAPRGGAAFGLYAGGIPALFGGTDGDRYFNDTWILQEAGIAYVGDTNGATAEVSDGWRWILVEPGGEFGTPAPRAYPMVGDNYDLPPVFVNVSPQGSYGDVMLMFGGRAGTLPTSDDTDGDWVEDGLEMDLGGPIAGRDPRANALIGSSAALNTAADETIPYAYKLLGGMVYDFPEPTRVSYIADFESLWHPLTEIPGNPEYNQAVYFGYPGEGKRTPPTTLPSFWTETGYDAMVPQSTNLWWHRYGGIPADDPRDEWEHGFPEGSAGGNTVPPLAYSGRWCYGTDLDATYENNAVMELYSPFLSLEVPDLTSSSPNSNDWYLVFHEWLDLADENDWVSIEAVRPNRLPDGTAGADILTRVSGTEPPRPTITILPPRNNFHNTVGEWRRVFVPLTLKEPDLYFKFMLTSDEAGNAGGWYIDDVAIIQAGEILGTYTNAGDVHLAGAEGTNILQSVTPYEGAFLFQLLPAGEYRLFTGDGGTPAGAPILGDNTWQVTVDGFLDPDSIVVGISINSPVLITWNAIPNGIYEVQYATPESILTPAPWTVLDTVVAGDEIGEYVDWDSETEESRFYRIVFQGMDGL